jgi:hypothetical protein
MAVAAAPAQPQAAARAACGGKRRTISLAPATLAVSTAMTAWAVTASSSACQLS